MFLQNLTKEQKDLFLDLCLFAINIDGKITAVERKMLSDYCQEMHIDNRQEPKSENYEEVLKKLKSFTDKTDLKKITVEIIALFYVDGLESEERLMLEKTRQIFDFSHHDMDDLLFATRHLLHSYELLRNVLV